MSEKLTHMQQRFVEEYMVDNNASAAARRAGYCEKTAESQGSRLLRNVKVATALTDAREQQQERTQITADSVLHDLAYVHLALQRVGDAGELNLSAALKALELIGRHFKMFTDKAEITGVGAPLVVVGGPAVMGFDEWERKAKERLRR
ncbi:terminase small subunit [bacterium]|nr:terminase small subunit [bacterium]